MACCLSTSACRYAVVPTPLSRLCFWRLVLDEAQQVQGSTAKAAEMSRLLQATHRWAVTGMGYIQAETLQQRAVPAGAAPPSSQSVLKQ